MTLDWKYPDLADEIIPVADASDEHPNRRKAMTTTAKSRTEIQSEINTLLAVEHLVETNAGTYGDGDVRRSGCAGGMAERNVYETVGGQRRATGPSEDRAPGRMRTINRETMSDDRKRLADLRAALRGNLTR